MRTSTTFDCHPGQREKNVTPLNHELSFVPVACQMCPQSVGIRTLDIHRTECWQARSCVRRDVQKPKLIDILFQCEFQFDIAKIILTLTGHPFIMINILLFQFQLRLRLRLLLLNPFPLYISQSLSAHECVDEQEWMDLPPTNEWHFIRIRFRSAACWCWQLIATFCLSLFQILRTFPRWKRIRWSSSSSELDVRIFWFIIPRPEKWQRIFRRRGSLPETFCRVSRFGPRN